MTGRGSYLAPACGHRGPPDDIRTPFLRLRWPVCIPSLYACQTSTAAHTLGFSGHVAEVCHASNRLVGRRQLRVGDFSELGTIPVHLYAVTETHTVRLHEIHTADGSRVQHRRFCAAEGRERPPLITPLTKHEEA